MTLGEPTLPLLTPRAELVSRFMAAMLSREQVSIYGVTDLVSHAIRLADALIDELNETENGN